MTSTPPDPDPDRTPGLERGGGVRPGDTPPDSASATEGVSHREPAPAKSTSKAVMAVIVISLIAVLGVVIAVGVTILGAVL